jgi:tRNA (cmo5U34)-methyltransferase
LKTTEPYRWNTNEAAEAFDAAAQFIHPLYTEIQQLVVNQLPFDKNAALFVVDLGGGSGRLIERILTHFFHARAANVDQSEAFLAIAERRLRPFGDRALLIHRRLQDDWPAELKPHREGEAPAEPNAIVSMSAIHHLDSTEKRTLYRRCYETLAPGGIFINGDEYRPESDAEYLAAMKRWNAHKDAATAAGHIPDSFQATFDHWYDRNIRRFGETKKSGDDCHETLAAQQQYLHDAGFAGVEVPWSQEMWGLLIGYKA